jgi:hypothetical protein
MRRQSFATPPNKAIQTNVAITPETHAIEVHTSTKLKENMVKAVRGPAPPPRTTVYRLIGADSREK